MRRDENISVLLGEVLEVDVDARRVALDSEPFELEYDYLILAAGARHSYFGHDQWEKFAPGLKSIEDGIEMRRRFLLAFERAEGALTDAERDAYLTFVIVGGGPTGVELSGALPAIACRALVKDFRRIDTTRTRVILVEAGPRVLASFPESLGNTALRDLAELGVEVMTETRVTGVDAEGVTLDRGRISAKTVFWAAGNTASPLGKFLGVPLDRAGRVLVESDLSVPGRSEVFVVGDLASVTQDGRLVPGVAPAAIQEGASAAKNILRDARKQPRRPFRYRNKGDLATIGRSKAIAYFPRFQVTGRLAWWFWLFLHILYLIGFRNRASVMLQWAYSYFTYQRGVRLITASAETSPEGTRKE